MKRIVRLTTTGLSDPVGVHLFQFGTVPAPTGSWGQLADSVAPGRVDREVCWLDGDMVVAQGQQVRFDLRFEVNVHNSASLQLVLGQGTPDAPLQWRWSAPIGYVGTWSSDTQQAPWFDDGMDYCITIAPAGVDVVVQLAEHPGGAGGQCAFIPAQSHTPAMARPPR